MINVPSPKDVFPKAACVLIVREEDNYVLAVSRRDDMTNLGLPGGKSEPGESTFETACRELHEEAGMECCVMTKLHEGFVSGSAQGGQAYWVEAYEGHEYGISFQDVTGSDEGVALFVHPDELIKPTCTFREFNYETLRKAGFFEDDMFIMDKLK